jgi:transcription-repair coupling factor (superfamily II helicase)
MSDLQIRGGGNILGESQSGNIAAVGYDLYLDLLQRTVEDLKRRELLGEEGKTAEIEPEINLGISAYIPENYISNTDQRYIAYRKITSLDKAHELDDMEDELRDRYGHLPPETVNLLRIILLKIDLRHLKIIKLDKGPDTLVFSFHEHTPINPTGLMTMLQQSKGKMRLTPDNRLIVKQSMSTDAEIFKAVQKTLQVLTKLS